MNCELCAFNNPKGTVTAIFIRDGRLLIAKRAEEPFKGEYDFIGGYMKENETPEQTIRREIKEELNISLSSITPIGIFPGHGIWYNKRFPIISHAFLVETTDEISRIQTKEITDIEWMPIDTNIPIAFDSNQKILQFIKDNFWLPLPQIEKLIKQLDSSAEINEQYFYKAALNGYISKKFIDDDLIGFGCIFPRNTLLRRQAVIEDMIVDEDFRGFGVGRAILQDLLKWAREHEIDVVELTTNAKRVAANALYASEGFWLHPTNHYLYNVRNKT